MTEEYSVKVTGLDNTIDLVELGKLFEIERRNISIGPSPNQSSSTNDVWINDFSDSKAAKDFADQWNSSVIKESTIECQVVLSQMETKGSGPGPKTPNLPKECRFGLRCYKPKCPQIHPTGWNPPKDERRIASVSNNRVRSRLGSSSCLKTNKVSDKDSCDVSPGPRHIKEKKITCPDGINCLKHTCPLNHPPGRNPCLSGQDCKNSKCQFMHPDNWAHHCKDGLPGSEYSCTLQHPHNQDSSKTGVDSDDEHGSHIFQPEQSAPSEIYHVPTAEPIPKMTPKKFPEQKCESKTGQHSDIPFLEGFCQRLKKEHVIIVTAETGSCTSTKLAEHAAKYFKRKVAYTHPHAMTVVALAHNTAMEYDGRPIGSTVGYQIGFGDASEGNRCVQGTDIMFMTDAVLVQKYTNQPRLDEFNVIIIDGVHQRSLNTDFLMGLAKILLKKRTEDFYVVILSATNIPNNILRLFSCLKTKPLKTPNSLHNVSVEYIPKGKKSIANHVVSVLQKVFSKHQGTTLVFLPSQKLIENAIVKFNKAKLTNSIAFPLHEGSSFEEQQTVFKFNASSNEGKRMVVFCTNVAETLLAIPNIQLIIDSGLIKEQYFDENLHLTIVDTVQISKVSAELRRNQAGQCMKGHCVRLYDEEDIFKAEIEPALFRESIDFVVLQLIFLKQNPSEFPFIDQPSPGVLTRSINLLKDIKCISAGGAITLRGELFLRLGIDPKYSAFLINCYLEHEPILELAAILTAILVVSTPIFMIETDNKKRELLRERIAQHAKEYDSDLFYFASIYTAWANSSRIDVTNRKCCRCGQIFYEDKLCGSCLVKYSIDNSINHITMRSIENMKENLTKTLKDATWKLLPARKDNADTTLIIGRNLAIYFPENLVYLKNPQQPSSEVVLKSNKSSVKIAATSAIYERTVAYSEFVAMNIELEENDTILINCLHPCKRFEKNS